MGSSKRDDKKVLLYLIGIRSFRLFLLVRFNVKCIRSSKTNDTFDNLSILIVRQKRLQLGVPLHGLDRRSRRSRGPQHDRRPPRWRGKLRGRSASFVLARRHLVGPHRPLVHPLRCHGPHQLLDLGQESRRVRSACVRSFWFYPVVPF